jgi:hypothetical protein
VGLVGTDGAAPGEAGEVHTDGRRGPSIVEIAAGAGMTRSMVSVWRKRFRDLGPDGLLADAPGRGRRKNYGAEQRVDVLALACTKPPDGSTRWSVRKLAAAVGAGRTMVHGILWSTSGATTGTTPGHSAGPTPGSRSPYDDPFI